MADSSWDNRAARHSRPDGHAPLGQDRPRLRHRLPGGPRDLRGRSAFLAAQGQEATQKGSSRRPWSLGWPTRCARTGRTSGSWWNSCARRRAARPSYAANPGLAKTWPTEAAFLEAASRWHKEVVSAPDLTRTSWSTAASRSTVISADRCAWAGARRSGRAVYVTFESVRKPGDKGPRRIAELDVR